MVSLILLFKWLGSETHQLSPYHLNSGRPNSGLFAPRAGPSLYAAAMNPAELDALNEKDKQELLGIIETMQTRDRHDCKACRNQTDAPAAFACTTAWWSDAS